MSGFWAEARRASGHNATTAVAKPASNIFDLDVIFINLFPPFRGEWRGFLAKAGFF
jgi:hypothetical protein